MIPWRRLLAVLLGALALAPVSWRPVHAHQIAGFVSQGGLDYLEVVLPALLPPRLQIDRATLSIGCVQLAQRHTTVDLQLSRVRLEIPQTGVLRLRLDGTISGAGKFDVNACGLAQRCIDQFALRDAGIVVEFSLGVGEGGRPQVTVRAVEIAAGDRSVEFSLSGCSVEGLSGSLQSGDQTQLVLEVLELAASQIIGPVIEELLTGLSAIEIGFAGSRVRAAVESLNVYGTGLGIGLDVDLEGDGAVRGCGNVRDPGEPGLQKAELPDLTTTGSHLALGINEGLINDVIYQVWRGGLNCLDRAALAELGIELDLISVESLLPGFSQSGVDLEVRLIRPPTIRSRPGEPASFELSLTQLEVAFSGRGLEEDAVEITVQVDARAEARLTLDEDRNGVTAQVDAVVIERLGFADPDRAAELGLDPARMRHTLQRRLLPGLLARFARAPLTGRVVGLAGIYLILRELRTSTGFVIAELDMFRAPPGDRSAPDTFLARQPPSAVNPDEAALLVSGRDPEVPPELLRYRVRVDGAVASEGFQGGIKVGRPGRSGRHRVEVAAVDLAGNTDPSPVTLDLVVDGVPPHVVILSDRVAGRPAEEVQVQWQAEDDTTAPEQLATEIELHRLADDGHVVSAGLAARIPLAPGTREFAVPIPTGDAYRIEVHTTDRARNRTVVSVLVPAAPACGCGTGPGGGRAATGGALLALVCALFLGRRRSARLQSGPACATGSDISDGGPGRAGISPD